MCPLLLLALCVGMVAFRPLTPTAAPQQEMRPSRYPDWPGVPDERNADAEVDNAYELYKWQTERSISKVNMKTMNRAPSNNA